MCICGVDAGIVSETVLCLTLQEQPVMVLEISCTVWWCLISTMSKLSVCHVQCDLVYIDFICRLICSKFLFLFAHVYV